jgi:membrane-associated phospholipid phosphatase
MLFKQKSAIFCILIVFNSQIFSQTETFSPAEIIVPSALITLGAILYDKPSKNFDEIIDEYRGKRYKFDDALQFFPHTVFYGFSLFGLEAKHSYFDRTLLLGTSGIFMLSSVLPLKHITKVERPDKSNLYSFPSGHTATAFWGAELVRREYPVWCGILAYTAASGVASMRIYNKKHWIGDVVAGAGFGILSTNAAYWILPAEKKLLLKKTSSPNEPSFSFLPYYNGEILGLSLVLNVKQ